MKNKVGKFLVVTLAAACTYIPTSSALELSTKDIADELKDMYGQAPDRITVIGEHVFTEALTNEALMLGATSINTEITDANIKDKSILNNMTSWRFNADIEGIDAEGNIIVKDYTFSNALTGKNNPEEGQKYNIKYIDYQNIDNVVKVTFNYGDKKEVKRLEKGAKVEKPADPTKEGYIFKGWTLNGQPFDFENTTLTENIELVAEFKNQTETVEDQTSLNGALADAEITKIVLGKSFTVDSSIEVLRNVTIDGNGNTISFKTVPTYVSGGDNYVFKVYGASADKKANVTFTNMSVTNSLGAIIAGDNSVVTIDNVDVSGNKWGGIEVKDSLVVKSITMTDEYAKHPVVWVDNTENKESITFEGDLANTVFKTVVDGQTQYYLSEENSKVEKNIVTFNDGVTTKTVAYEKGAKVVKPEDPVREGYKFIEWRLKGETTAYDFENSKLEEDIELVAVWVETVAHVTDAETLNAALALENIEKIILDKSFTVDSSVIVSRNVTIDGGANTISFKERPTYTSGGSNYVFKVYGASADAKANVTFTNMKITNSLGAIIAGANSVVTVDNVDVADNAWGGIEVIDTLVVNGLTMNDENYAHPAVWVDTANVETAKVTFDGSYKVKVAEQDQYYLVEANSKAYQAATAEDIAKALANKNVTKIVLTADVADAFEINRDVEIDLNQKTVNNAVKVTSGNVTLKNGKITNKGAAVLTNGENTVVTLEEVDVTSEANIAIDVNNKSKVVISSGKYNAAEFAVKVYNASTLEVNGGEFTTTDNAVIGTNGSNGQGKNIITVNGGTFNGNIKSAGYIAAGVYLANDDTLVLNGGTFNIKNGSGLILRSGKTTVSDKVVINVNGSLAGKVGDAATQVPSGKEIVLDNTTVYPGGAPTITNNSKYAIFNLKVAKTEAELKSLIADETVKEITLNADLDLTAALAIERDLTLNLAGHTINNLVNVTKGNVKLENGTINSTKNAVTASGEGTVVSLNNVTIKSGNIAVDASNKAKIVVDNANINSTEFVFRAVTEGTLVINSGEFTAIDNAVIGTNGLPGKGKNTITVNGGTFNGNIKSAGYIAAGVYLANDDTLVLNGGTFNITNGSGLVLRSGKTTVSDKVVFNVTGTDTGKVGDAATQIPAGKAIIVDTKTVYPGGAPTITNNSSYEVFKLEN